MKINFYKNLLLVIVSILYFYFAFREQSFNTLFYKLNELNLNTIFIIIFLLTISLYLTSIRLKVSLNFFKINVNLLLINKINIFGQLLGSVFNNLIGSIFGRSLVAKEYNLIPKIFPFITLYEKFLMFGSIIIVNLCLFFINSDYYSDLTLNWGLSAFIFSFIVLIINFFLVFIFSPKKYKKFFIIPFKFLLSKNSMLIFIICIFITLITILSYSLICINFLNNEFSYINLFFIFGIVTLISALPISYSGWGIRELSTVYLFKYFGYDQSVGLLTALLVGLISLIILLINYFIINNIKINFEKHNYLFQDKVNLDFEKFIKFFIYFAFIFIFINFNYAFKVPILGNIINISLSDFFTIIISFIFLYEIFLKKNYTEIWAYKFVPHFILSFGILIIYGLIVAQINGGIGKSALMNKFIGYFILISYFLTGTYFINKYDKSKIFYFICATIFSAIFIYFIKFSTMAYLSYQTKYYLVWYYEHFNSLLYNRNSFAFALLMIFVLLCYINNKKYFAILTSLILFLIFVSLSKTSLVLISFFIIILLFLRKITIKQILLILILFSVHTSLHNFVFKDKDLQKYNFTTLDNFKNKEVVKPPQTITRQINSIIIPRSELIYTGIKIWKEKPIFGHGLGNTIYMVYERYKNKTEFPSILEKTPVSLHNTFLWLICEMGLVGLIIFIFYPIRIISSLILSRIKKREYFNNQDLSFLSIIFLTILFSMVHDILYQRIFWIVLGIIISKSIFNLKYETKVKIT